MIPDLSLVNETIFSQQILLTWFCPFLGLTTFGLFVIGMILWVGGQLLGSTSYQSEGESILNGALRFLVATFIVGYMAGIWR